MKITGERAWDFDVFNPWTISLLFGLIAINTNEFMWLALSSLFSATGFIVDAIRERH